MMIIERVCREHGAQFGVVSVPGKGAPSSRICPPEKATRSRASTPSSTVMPGWSSRRWKRGV